MSGAAKRGGPRRSVVITGATAGLGLATARVLAGRGWHVVLACRSRERGERARAHLAGTIDGFSGEVLELDVSLLASVRRFAALLGESAGSRPPLAALVCNAGVQIAGPVTRTAEGIETTFATNHLGHFLLSRLLAPAIAAGGAIVVVASNTHDPAQRTGMPAPDLGDMRALAAGADAPDAPPAVAGRRRYTTTKLCNVLCAYELDRRLRGSDGAPPAIATYAFDPGMMPGTGLARDYGPLARLVWRYLLPALVLVAPNVNTVSTSARRLARLVEQPHACPSGSYVSRGRPCRSSAASYERETALALWRLSCQLCDLPEDPAARP